MSILPAFLEPVLMQLPQYQNHLVVMLNVRLSYQIVSGMENQLGDAKTSIQHAQVMSEPLLNAALIPNKDALNLQILNPNIVNQHLVVLMP